MIEFQLCNPLLLRGLLIFNIKWLYSPLHFLSILIIYLNLCYVIGSGFKKVSATMCDVLHINLIFGHSYLLLAPDTNADNNYGLYDEKQQTNQTVFFTNVPPHQVPHGMWFVCYELLMCVVDMSKLTQHQLLLQFTYNRSAEFGTLPSSLIQKRGTRV